MTDDGAIIQNYVEALAASLERITTLEAALRRSDALLSLLRFRAERTIPWGDVGYPERREVDQVIGQSRAALADAR